MKIWKLVSGVLSILFSCLIVFQSCAAGIANTIEKNGEVSGTAGVLVAILIFTGGIVSLATMNKKGGNAAIGIILAIGAIIGYALSGSFTDLMIWSTWALICAIMAIVALIMEKN